MGRTSAFPVIGASLGMAAAPCPGSDGEGSMPQTGADCPRPPRPPPDPLSVSERTLTDCVEPRTRITFLRSAFVSTRQRSRCVTRLTTIWPLPCPTLRDHERFQHLQGRKW